MTHIKSKRKLTVAIGVFVVLVAFSLFPPIQLAIGVAIFGIQTSADIERCGKLVENLLKLHEFKINSLSAPGKKAVFCNAGTGNGFIKSHDKIIVYSVTENSEQEAIINIIKQIQNIIPVNEVHIEFYKEENWQVYRDSEGKVVGGKRGREERIALFKVRNES